MRAGALGADRHRRRDVTVVAARGGSGRFSISKAIEMHRAAENGGRSNFFPPFNRISRVAILYSNDAQTWDLLPAAQATSWWQASGTAKVNAYVSFHLARRRTGKKLTQNLRIQHERRFFFFKRNDWEHIRQHVSCLFRGAVHSASSAACVVTTTRTLCHPLLCQFRT